MVSFRRTLLLIALAALPALAQTSTDTTPALPANAAFAGMGFQKTANPQISGWAEACHRNPDVSLLGLTLPSYLCGATDYSGSVSSARADIDTVLFTRGSLAGGTKMGAGAAVASSSVGASYDLGVWGTVDVSKFLKIDGAKLAASVTWQKNDVSVAASGTASQVLKAFADAACFRFGFGKTW